MTPLNRGVYRYGRKRYLTLTVRDECGTWQTWEWVAKGVITVTSGAA